MNNPKPVPRAPVKLEKFRDLTLARCAGQLLAFACDSSGSVGGLPEDCLLYTSVLTMCCKWYKKKDCLCPGCHHAGHAVRPAGPHPNY